MILLIEKIETIECITYEFCRTWIDLYKQLDLNFLSKNPDEQFLLHYGQILEEIELLFISNHECSISLDAFPGINDEKQLLLWLVENQELYNELFLSHIFFLEDSFLSDDTEKLLIQNKPTVLNFGPLSLVISSDHRLIPEVFPVAYSEIKSTIEFMELIYPLYNEKFTEYCSISIEDIEKLRDDHIDKINYHLLSYHLIKKGVI